jgi:antitoxin component of MazEF toxin-antitoxin module
MAEKQTFETVLEKHEAMDATGITIPFDVEKVFGAKRVPVKVRINGAEHRSTIIRMGGKYVVGVPKVFREAAGVKAGEAITVILEKDNEKRTVEVPKDLAEALTKADLTDVFSKMSYTHQKEYVNAVIESKREETRLRRIDKTIEQLISKRK